MSAPNLGRARRQRVIAALYDRHLAALAAASAAEAAPPAAASFALEDGAPASPDAVPRHGAPVRILGRANRAAGGGAVDFTTEPARALADLARACARALGLRLAGIDLFDISPARDLSDLLVIEANASPAFETLEELGRCDLIERIWCANLRAALR
jgi:hypothetical protein